MYFRGFLCTFVDNHTAVVHETCCALKNDCAGALKQGGTEIINYG